VPSIETTADPTSNAESGIAPEARISNGSGYSVRKAPEGDVNCAFPGRLMEPGPGRSKPRLPVGGMQKGLTNVEACGRSNHRIIGLTPS